LIVKRLALITNEFPPATGGIGTYALEMARAAVALGHRVTVLAPSFGRATREYDRGLPFQVLRYQGRGASVRDYPALVPAALTLARRRDFDVVHACDSSSLAALAVTQPLHRRSFIATVHGSDVNRAGHGLYGRVAKLAGFYTRPARIFANSEYTRSLLLQNCRPFDADRAVVSPLGVDSHWFEAPGPATWLADYGVGSEHQLVVCVARIAKRKGQLTALRAFQLLPEGLRARARLVVIGEATASEVEYADQLRREATTGAGVILAGHRSLEEIRAVYARAQAFVLPGGADGPWVEGFGLVFLEAAAQCLPSVAGRQGGVPEAVLGEQTGLLVPPSDTGALARALERMLLDDPLRRRLGEAARARARTFTWRRCAEQTYSELPYSPGGG
jgi:glycosyltransferase involved in cell wall biosynthesis